MRRMILTISPEGEVSLQTTGFADGTCKDASRAMEKALGLTVSDRPTADSVTTLPNQVGTQ
jgi:hypothetical protein